MKRIIALLLVIALTAALSVSLTMAYLQDTDDDVNVMTLGNVYIEQNEYQRAEGVVHTGLLEDGNLVDFVQGQALYPAVPSGDGAYTAEPTDLLYWGPYVTADSDGTAGDKGAGNGLWNDNKLANVMDKMIFVKNTGKSDCYYRTIIAFECPVGMEYSQGSDKEFMMNVNGNDRFSWENVGYINVGTTRYLVMVATYNEILPAGEISRPSLLQVVMTHNATNEDVKLLGDTYEILALSQAVQTEGFNTPVDALNAAFGEITATSHPWDGKKVQTSVADTAALAEAVKEGYNTIVLEEGTYTLPAVKNGEFTIVGDKNTVIDLTMATGQNLSGTDITFSGVTIKGTNDNYIGIQHAGNIVYNNVTFNESTTLYGESATFNNCTFNLTDRYIWTYGAKDVVFNNCTFNTDGKAILVYNEMATTAATETVTISDCTFNATTKGSTSSGAWTAAVEIGAGCPFVVNFTGTNTVSENFNGLWRDKAQDNGNLVQVYVNGTLEHSAN